MQALIKKSVAALSILATTLSAGVTQAFAASHAEAPLIALDRSADNTDTYAFRSVESGREGFVTLIANYIPFQEPSNGPPILSVRRYGPL